MGYSCHAPLLLTASDKYFGSSVASELAVNESRVHRRRVLYAIVTRVRSTIDPRHALYAGVMSVEGVDDLRWALYAGISSPPPLALDLNNGL
jgi:hypothetical protein